MTPKIGQKPVSLTGLSFEALNEAVRKGREHLLNLQSPDGYWAGELEADSSVAAGYIPLMYYLTGKVRPERCRRIVNHVLGKQQADGSWPAYHGGPGNLNVSIQNYFALKLAGVSAEEDSMQRARRFIVSRGGITSSNVFNRIWLALFGQYDWRGVPSLPPEIILLPDWFYFSIYEFASWSRATIVALMVVLTRKPVCRVPEPARIDELYVEPEGTGRDSTGKARRAPGWESFFLFMDRLFKLYEKLPLKPGRGLAVRRVERWLADHQEADGSWGGIMLPWVYALIGLKSLGYPLDHPVMARGMKGLEYFTREDERTTRLQPATSPIWDTAWAVVALSETGLAPDDPALVRAARWLLEKEVRVKGDWRIKTRAEPGAWSFEFFNSFYPDIDDTAVVPRALRRVRLSGADDKARSETVERGLDWVLAMQSRDGGWAAFDRDNNKRILSHIPFADFMTPLDPTSPDVTAHVLELMGEMSTGGGPLRRAFEYVRKTQEADGAWYGRWGVNYLYGTGLILAGLRSAGEDMGAEYVRRAVDWLKSSQNPDGGWGETCATYDDPSQRGRGPSTASQTAWALLGIIAAGEWAGPEAERGIAYLVGSQQPDGSWHEEAYTGTGFPRAFYLRYDLYRIYFPLMVLARYKSCLEETNAQESRG